MRRSDNDGRSNKKNYDPSTELSLAEEKTQKPEDRCVEPEHLTLKRRQSRDQITSLIIGVYDTEKLCREGTITAESQNALMLMRIRVAYEAGRDKTVKSFVGKAKLLEYMKGIDTQRSDVLKPAQYMEALAAYHRYCIGGKKG